MLYALIGHVKTTRFTGGYYYLNRTLSTKRDRLTFGDVSFWSGIKNETEGTDDAFRNVPFASRKE